MDRLKATRRQLKKNLNTLQEREAKWGNNAPLELLNQIEDHQKAITLTEQAILGDLSEAEWLTALKPLLIPISNGQVVNIEAEFYVAGDVAGDVVGEDKVLGDKNIFQGPAYIYENPPPPLPPAEAKERRELGILLQKVKQFWIEGVLEKSVHNMALIDLGKETQAEAVAHAWEQVLELPNQSRQTLPPDKKISQIFDEMNRALLILGEPGTGKTITLLQLARDLIERVAQDEHFIEPVPVVFNLSTWRQGEPLLRWLVTELSTKYQIPRRIGRPWLEQNRLLPLLDGLDEVNFADRAACVEAINAFGQEVGLSGLAVCSRLAEYTDLPVRLKLNGAIRLQPLTLEQVCDYLESAGEQLMVLRTVLEVYEGLQNLAQTPLTLELMVLAYQDLSVEELVGKAHHSLEARRRYLFESYVKRMFRRKGQGDDCYGADRTKQRLAWLGQQMHRHNQAIFLIEQLQPSWLVSRGWIWAYLLLSRIIPGLVLSLTLGFTFWMNVVRRVPETDTQLPGLGGWLVYGLMIGLFGGLLITLIEGRRYQRGWKSTVIDAMPIRRQQVFNIVWVGLVFGVGAGLISWLFAGPWVGKLMGVSTGVTVGFVLELYFRRESLNQDVLTVEALDWSWQRALKRLRLGLAGGLVAGLIFGWILAQNQAILDSLLTGSITGLLGERLFVVGVGLFYSLFGGVIASLFGGLNSQLIDTKIRSNEGMWLTLRNALLIGPIFGLIIMLAGWLLFVPLFGFTNGRDVGLGWGLLFGMYAFSWFGGFDVIRHVTLRLLFWFQGRLPLNTAHFLDHAADLIFLQKVGGGYIFIHRLLLEHFAAMEPDAD